MKAKSRKRARVVAQTRMVERVERVLQGAEVANLTAILQDAFQEADLGNARRAADCISKALDLVRGWQ